MKIKNLFFASLAALTFAACSNEDAPAPEAGVTFKLAASSVSVKADESPTVTGEAVINNADIYIYKRGEGEAYTHHATLPVATATATATINLPAGEYRAIAAVNAPDGLTTTTPEELRTNAIALSANTKTSFVMFGEGTPINVDSDGTGTGLSQTITVTRLVAGIQIGNLTFSLPADVEAAYKTAVGDNNVKIVSFKIKNSPVSAVLATGASSGTPSYLANLMFATYEASTMVNGVLTKNSESSADRIYSYAQAANSTELQLCLKFGNLAPSYYNIALGDIALERNCMYTLNAVITGTGSSTDTGKDGITQFSLLVQNWQTGAPINGSVGN